MTSKKPNLSSMSEQELLELVWENGKVNVRNLPRKTQETTTTSSSCILHMKKTDNGEEDTFNFTHKDNSQVVPTPHEYNQFDHSLKQFQVPINPFFKRMNSSSNFVSIEEDLIEKQKEKVNFSLFLRSPSLVQVHNSKRSRNNNPVPVEESMTITRINQQNSIETNAKMLPSSAKTPDMRSPDQVHAQTPANMEKEKLNIEKTSKDVASSSLCSRAASNSLTFTLKRRYEDTTTTTTTTTDGSTDDHFSEDFEEKPERMTKAVTRGGTKRRRAAQVHNLCERRRRDKINKKMRALQELIPNSNKVDKASMLDEAIEYLKTLQFQVQMMSMGTGICMPPMMLHPAMQQMLPPQMTHFSPMGVGMGMQMPMGLGCSNSAQFLIPPIPGATTAMPGIPETRFQMPGFPGQTMPISVLPAPVSHLQKTVPVAGVARAAASMELMCSAPLSYSKDSIQNTNLEEINNANVDCSKFQSSI